MNVELIPTVRSLEPGRRVRVTGLREGLELRGLIVSFDEAKHKWRVRMTDGVDRLVETARLEALPSLDEDAFQPGQRVRVVALHKATGLNGSEGMVLEYDRKDARWRVRLDDGAGKKFKPQNLEAADGERDAPPDGEMAIGRRVRIFGLVRDLQLNDVEGVLVEHDAADNRWKVRLADGTGKKLRPHNLEVLAAGQGSEVPPGGFGGLRNDLTCSTTDGAIVDWDDSPRDSPRRDVGAARASNDDDRPRASTFTFGQKSKKSEQDAAARPGRKSEGEAESPGEACDDSVDGDAKGRRQKNGCKQQ